MNGRIFAFRPKVHECTIEDGGESFTFYVREPSGRSILAAAEESKKNPDRPAIENARKLFADHVVAKQEGSDGEGVTYRPLTNEEVDEFLDMRLTAMTRATEIVQDKIGLTRLVKDKEKNV